MLKKNKFKKKIFFVEFTARVQWSTKYLLFAFVLLFGRRIAFAGIRFNFIKNAKKMDRFVIKSHT